jgi:hypothetical protein
MSSEHQFELVVCGKVRIGINLTNKQYFGHSDFCIRILNAEGTGSTGIFLQELLVLKTQTNLNFTIDLASVRQSDLLHQVGKSRISSESVKNWEATVKNEACFILFIRFLEEIYCLFVLAQAEINKT